VISFILNTLKLLTAIWHGVRQDEEFRILSVSLFTIIAGGTIFYWQVEGWSVIDSLYFCFMTMSTIGYGDLVPTTSYSKLFTIVFSVLTIGMFAAIVSKLVLVIVKDKSQRNMRKSSTHDVTKNE
jgi:hypothetical protein